MVTLLRMATHTNAPDDRLPTAAAAGVVGVHPQTLRNYEERGFITSTRTPGGQRRFRRADVEALRDNPPRLYERAPH